ncbi:MAG: hypothetical protein M3R00_06430, partial [Pseudomonadota bacterium]|nr:hypothetical protein [Pseudomonadota bacterium]
MKSTQSNYEKLDDDHRFTRSDFPLPPRTLFPEPGAADIKHKGLELTSVKSGRLYENIAADIIRKNYVDVWILTYLFSVKRTVSNYGAPLYEMDCPSKQEMLRAYNALKENRHIQTISFDHFKHSKAAAQTLLQAIAFNKRLPLRVLSLNSIVLKRRISRNPQAPPYENWMLAFTVEFLPVILATHKLMSHLSLASNRLGLLANDDQLMTIGHAITRCKFLHTLDLDKNKFSFQQAMLLIKVISTNKSITTLKLTCKTKSREEKNILHAAVSAFLKINCDRRDALKNAINNADLELVKRQFLDGDFVLHSIEGESCTQYTND